MEDKNKSKAIELAVASIEKEYGKGSIMRLKEGQTLTPDTGVVPSGSIGLDIALGIGGYPRGRIMEIYGPESSGKTTLTLHAIAQVQKLGGVAAFIDAEHALDPAYARKLGVKTDELLISPAGLRRAGARDRRHARPLRRGRPRRGRLGRGARPEGRDRGGHGRQPRRDASAPHVAGAPQAHRDGRASRTACSSSSTRSA